jgi:hypothetical protein
MGCSRSCLNGNTAGGVHPSYAQCSTTAEFLSNFLMEPAFCVLPSDVFTLPCRYIKSYSSYILYVTCQVFRNSVFPYSSLGGGGFNFASNLLYLADQGNTNAHVNVQSKPDLIKCTIRGVN